MTSGLVVGQTKPVSIGLTDYLEPFSENGWQEKPAKAMLLLEKKPPGVLQHRAALSSLGYF
jgi:hypothetical protein